MTANDPIQYEFDTRPDSGKTAPIADGVQWLRMPLPFVLGHINLWLLEDGDCWTIVDSGADVEEAQAVWDRTFIRVLDNRSVSRVIATHMHPDHSGMLGSLCRRTGASLWMTREEYLMCRILAADTGQAVPPEAVDFYRAAGFDDEAIARYIRMFGLFGKFVSPLPKSYRRLRDGESLRIGSHDWQVIVGRGHSPEHACLYCSELNLLISGDQLLPTISSNVSVFPTEPDADPLHDWFESLEKLKSIMPEDVLVLPAHGRPFRGAHRRLDELIEEHTVGLEKMLRLCESPVRAVDVFPALFKRPIDARNLVMATGEAIAHLNYLVNRQRLGVETDQDGVRWYART